MITVAVVGHRAVTQAVATLLARWEQVRVVTQPAIDAIDQFDAPVLICAEPIPLTPAHAAMLSTYLQRGGALVATGAALQAWHDHPDLLHLLGVPAGQNSPHSELIVRVVEPAHPITQRFEARWTIVDQLWRGDPLPPHATPLLEVSWRMARHSVAYTQPVGAGNVFVTTLGADTSTQADPVFADLISRAVAHLAGLTASRSITVGMLGYGAIGQEHAEAIAAVPGLELGAVCDRNPERQAQVRALHPGVRVLADHHALAADPAIDLVIVSTPPNLHAPLALDMLRAGKHVVVEKPFCLTTAQADQLVSTASAGQRALTVYQNRRWDADFLAIKQVIERGTIGDVFALETFVGGYGHPCDYWHSDAATSGGVFYDWGSHYLDWILNLVPEPVARVSATEHKRVWHDVTNADHATIRLHFAHGVEAEFTHSDLAAALKPKWYVLGTHGAIVAQWRHESVKGRRWSGDLIEEQLQAAESPSQVWVHSRDHHDAIHQTQLTLPTPPAHAFHRNLADHLLLGAPLAVAPTSARRNIAVMEAATISAAEHGAWIEPR